MVGDTLNPNTWEAKAGQSWIWGQPGLLSKTLSQKKKTKTKNKMKTEK
jgi:hypothetical protein